ncbi:EamA-like transporter family protein [Xinfangfangia sp. D13-10-4-6]|uniref:DMT family transporter n=1 Tax=Pseudogemmobacter hezensis TaxID=2737662 RepID=UPI0015546605|nr:DMT family transporter [Pseudogemmobacter hezensis]NPD14817.1 EamA-like transporter family protein [Pseudogemmobacter hezensis]
MPEARLQKPSPFLLLAAFGSGALLSLMILCNATVTAHTNGHFSSLAAHGSGMLAALIVLAALPAARRSWRGGAPLWAFSGGLMGAVTVALGTVAVNSPLALSGMIALGLLGQVVYSLLADRFGWFGLPKRRPDGRDALVVGLILAGCLLIVWGGAA